MKHTQRYKPKRLADVMALPEQPRHVAGCHRIGQPPFHPSPPRTGLEGYGRS